MSHRLFCNDDPIRQWSHESCLFIYWHMGSSFSEHLQMTHLLVSWLSKCAESCPTSGVPHVKYWRSLRSDSVSHDTYNWAMLSHIWRRFCFTYKWVASHARMKRFCFQRKVESVAVCCYLLQSVAVCCSLLQSVAVCCSLCCNGSCSVLRVSSKT